MPCLAVIICTVLMGSGLAACGLGQQPGLPSATPDHFGGPSRPSSLAGGQESTLTPPRLAMPTSSGTVSPLPEGRGLATPDVQSSTTALNIACDRAAPSNPIDITIPDNSAFKPGEYFSKTWRLHNSGTCSWTRQYAAIFFSGDLLTAPHSVSLSEPVDPGMTTDITIDMMAQLVPGTNQGNWKLCNTDGTLFGIGPGGNAPFWVRIIDGIKQGAYFCYKTSLGLPGWARLVVIDLKTHGLSLETLTWAIP